MHFHMQIIKKQNVTDLKREGKETTKKKAPPPIRARPDCWDADYIEPRTRQYGKRPSTSQWKSLGKRTKSTSYELRIVGHDRLPVAS